MEIIIGRDAKTSGLNVVVDNTSHLVSSPNTVPKSVSRQHCELTINDDGTMRIKNINPQNKTYINGVAVMSKSVTRSDRVELGSDRYLLQWDLIDKALPQEADIRSLKEIWDTWCNDNRTVTHRTQRFQVIRGVLPVLTMSAVLIGYIFGGRGEVFYALYSLVIALTIFFSLKAWKDITKNDDKRESIKDKFTHDYCCPLCGYFFGFTDYTILTKNMDSCPKCKTKLRK